MLLRLADLSSGLCKIFLYDILPGYYVREERTMNDAALPVISNCKHASFCDDVTEIGTVESVRQLWYHESKASTIGED